MPADDSGHEGEFRVFLESALGQLGGLRSDMADLQREVHRLELALRDANAQAVERLRSELTAVRELFDSRTKSLEAELTALQHWRAAQETAEVERAPLRAQQAQDLGELKQWRVYVLGAAATLFAVATFVGWLVGVGLSR